MKNSFLKSFYERIYAKMNEKGYNPEQDFDVVEEGGTIKFAYRDSPMLFLVRRHQSDFTQYHYEMTRFNPSFSIKKFGTSDRYADLASVIKILDSWLDNELRNYVTECRYVSPWANLGEQFRFSASDEEKLNDEEVIEFENKLDQFVIEVKEQFHLTQEKVDLVLEEIKELKKDAKTDSKRKLIKTVIGTLFKLAIDLGLSEEKRATLCNLFMKVVQIIKAIPFIRLP
jgi:hypothetical protein